MQRLKSTLCVCSHEIADSGELGGHEGGGGQWRGHGPQQNFFFNVLYIRLNSLSSPLQSKAMFISGFYVSFWRALSCQQTPSQALNPEQNHKKRKLQSHNKID